MSIFHKVIAVVLLLATASCYKATPISISQEAKLDEVRIAREAEAMQEEIDARAAASDPVPVASVPVSMSKSFEEMLAGFPACEFDGLYIDVFTDKPANSYFIDRHLKPCRIDKEIDSAYFCINEKFHGLPVYEIEIPAATAGFSHAIYFDAPAAEARRLLKDTLGSEFRKSRESEEGNAPELLPDPRNSRRSFLMCASIAA